MKPVFILFNAERPFVTMKGAINFLVFIILLVATSCQAQKMVKNIGDAKQLKRNQQQFVGKLLSVLIAQIVP